MDDVLRYKNKLIFLLLFSIVTLIIDIHLKKLK